MQTDLCVQATNSTSGHEPKRKVELKGSPRECKRTCSTKSFSITFKCSGSSQFALLSDPGRGENVDQKCYSDGLLTAGNDAATDGVASGYSNLVWSPVGSHVPWFPSRPLDADPGERQQGLHDQDLRLHEPVGEEGPEKHPGMHSICRLWLFHHYTYK